ncbi:hypothetical protein GCM10009718_07430 [Isoptericola halotolerans]|uniref:Uncharacterized protein n=1 Tax=Isoptericola halotolerans TaxID=300560 RepID=A0ABX2A0L4_9MICO|nr:hypothetical protein [Isoptericola halotolerans]NOV96334.1 hypothetical protein [Isoptericola halotolerans]
MTARPRLVAALAVALLLTGCTGSPDEEPPTGATVAPDESAPTASESAQEVAAVGSADVTGPDVVMAEQTVDTPGEAGGTLTVVLRTLEVRDDTTTLRYALRWDNDDAPDGATASHYQLGIDWVPTVTDTAALVQYRPFCTQGAWKDGAISQQQCGFNVTASPRFPFDGFVNHATIEGWATLPAPDGEPATLDVALGQGLPVFTGATVSAAGDA